MLVGVKVRDILVDILNQMGVSGVDFAVDLTGDFSRGDYTTNIALVCAKTLNRSPFEVANEIKEKLEAQSLTEIAKIEVAGPGFINLWLKPEVLVDNLKNILALKEEYGKNDSGAGKKVMIEFTDPNPFKEFHIGHLMSNAIGEAIARLTEATGAEVRRTNYQGDVGLHVAKTIWGILQSKGEPSNLTQLAQAYVDGNKAYENDDKAKQSIIDLNNKIYSRSDEKINEIYDIGRETSLEYFETIYKQLGTQFDFYFYESTTGAFGKTLVVENTPAVFKSSEGAVIFPGEEFGLHNRVFINSQGLPTYEAKELGLAQTKFDHYQYDQSFIITGNEVNDYFKVLIKAMSFVYPTLAKKQVHIGHGMLRLVDGKMSSRSGGVVSALSLIEDIKIRIQKKMADEERVLTNSEQIAEDVAIGAIKYSILKQDIGKDIVFDFTKSITFTGNSGPYLQYMYVRTQSVLTKAGQQSSSFTKSELPTDLERLLIRFPDIVKRAQEEYAPHYLCTYLFSLASEFSSYYAKAPIIGSEYEDYRLVLTQAVGQVLKNGLMLLGLPTPAKM